MGIKSNLVIPSVVAISGGGGGGGDATWGSITGTLSNQTDLQNALTAKQDTLVSGTSIKTINNTTVLGSGNIAVQPLTTIQTLTTASTELTTNTIYNGGELASVTLTLPNTISADFIVQLEFSSGTTATTFTAPASLYFNGDACENGVFTPVANKRYCIMVISDGVNVLGFVYEK